MADKSHITDQPNSRLSEKVLYRMNYNHVTQLKHANSKWYHIYIEIFITFKTSYLYKNW